MKLLEILQKELTEFPKGMLYAVQDDDGEVKFGKHSQPTLGESGIWQRREDGKNLTIPRLELAEDWDSAIVTKDMWEKDRVKQIIVNVSGLSVEEKQRVNEALAKITGTHKLPVIDNSAGWFFAPASSGTNTVSWGWSSTPETPTHTPQRVLEMAGMETSADQHVFLADKFIITDSSGRIVYDGTLSSISSFIKSRVSAGKDGSLPSSGFSVKTDENGVAVMVTNQGHIHSHLMALYAEDAKTTDKPWELWQIKTCFGEWSNAETSPAWLDYAEYRRKPKTHIVNGMEVPDLRFAPKEGELYWFPDASTEKLAYSTYYLPTSAYDMHRASNNLCYEPTEEGKQAAILHAKAWLGIA